MKKHPEQKENEIYMGNNAGYPYYSGWHSKRIGQIAYDINGELINPDYKLVPWFINKDELLSAGYVLNSEDLKYYIEGYSKSESLKASPIPVLSMDDDIIDISKTYSIEEVKDLFEQFMRTAVKNGACAGWSDLDRWLENNIK